MCVSGGLTSALSVSSLPKHVANQLGEQHEKETKNKRGREGVGGVGRGMHTYHKASVHANAHIVFSH